MKVTLFTPCLAKSAIGRMASLVANALIERGVTVSVIRSEDIRHINDPIHDFGVVPTHWTKIDRVQSEINSSDVILYQIGDNFDFHKGCLHWLDRAPGIISLHDFYLGNLFLGWMLDTNSDPFAALQPWYTEDQIDHFLAATRSPNMLDLTATAAPLTEWISGKAEAVIAHSEWGCARVLSSCNGPVHIVPLAYNKLGSDVEILAPKRDRDGGMNLLTIGHMNPNKRVRQVIEAIGDSADLRRAVQYRLVGAIEENVAEELVSLAQRAGVSLEISGPVDDQLLHEALVEADVVSCLRSPTLEAASASAIEAMLNAKATIVSDHGFYSELPDDVVVKTDPENEIASITCALKDLLLNRPKLERIGLAAKDYASKAFTAANYASEIVRLGPDLATKRPIQEAVSNFANVAVEWEVTAKLNGHARLHEEMHVFASGSPGRKT